MSYLQARSNVVIKCFDAKQIRSTYHVMKLSCLPNRRNDSLLVVSFHVVCQKSLKSVVMTRRTSVCLTHD